MRGSLAIAFVTGLWAASVVSLSLVSPRDALPAVVGLETRRRAVKDPIARDALRKRNQFRKRQQIVSETLGNERALYTANVTIGTPSQDFQLHIDTGSSDMWVNAPQAQICQARRSPCSETGTYNTNASSTAKYISSNFNVSYVDGSGATGDYVTDNVGIGDKTLNALQLGVGYVSTTPEGILGIGYADDEGLVGTGAKAYSNMPMAMVNGGLIKSNAYSIWLDDLEASTGSILFGGVDTDKYHGSLQSLPVQKEDGQFLKFLITLSGASVLNAGKNTSLSSSLPAAVILDTGSSITYLPDNLAQDIFTAVDAQYNQGEGTAYASCNLASQNISIAFAFSSLTITVPISELIINPNNADTGNGQTFQGQDQLCLFGITAAQGDTAVLGDTFLRSAYIVFDLANNAVAMAQTNFNSTKTSIQEVGTGSDSIPDAQGVPNPIQAAPSATVGSRIGSSASTTTAKSGAAAMPLPSYLAFAVFGLIISAFSFNF